MRKNLLLYAFSCLVCLLGNVSTHAQLSPLNIGKISEGDSIVIYYDVTINTALSASIISITNQGTISGTNFTSFLTSDPKAALLFSPTITLLDPPPVVNNIVRKTPAGVLTNATSVVFTVTFSKIVSGVDTDDFTLTSGGTANGVVANVSSSTDTSIDVTVNTITGDGTIRLDVKSGGTGIYDSYAKPLDGGFTGGETYQFDHTAPTLTTVAIASNNANPSYARLGDLVTLSFTPSENMASLPLVTIATHSVTVTPGSGNSYTATYTLLPADGEGTVPFTIAYTDDAGNAGDLVSGTTNGSSVIYDRTPPSVTINQAAAQADPTSGTTIHFTVAFNEAVTGFTTAGLSISGTAGGTLTATINEVAPNNGTSFDVAVTGMTSDGTVSAQLGAGVAKDFAGNLSLASSGLDHTVTWISDAAPFVISSNRQSPLTHLTKATSVTYRVTFSEDVSGVDATDFSLTVTAGTIAGMVSSIAAVDGKTYDVIVTGVSGSGTIRLDLKNSGTGIQDLDGVTFDAVNGGFTTGQTYIIDQTVPTLSCPSGTSAAANSSCQAAVPNVLAGILATDNYSAPGALTITQTPTAGTMVGKGINAITVTATDEAGNQNTCITSFTVNDLTPPTFACPANITVSAPANACAASVSYTMPTAVDICGTATVTTDHASGSLFPVGTTTVTLTATDASGNTAQCTFTVRVNDVTPPNLSCPAAITANANGACQAAVPNFVMNASASDACSAVIITQSPVAGTLVGKGSVTVTLTATDASGNASQCTTTFTVQDHTPPGFVCPSPKSFTLAGTPGNCQTAVPNFLSGLVVADNCTSPGAILLSQSPAAGTMVGVGNTPITITATDASGNTAQCVSSFTVSDNSSPVFTTNLSASPVTIWPPDHKLKDILLNYAVSDNCALTYTVSVTSNEASGGTGDGDKSPDWVIDPLNPFHVQLRAERGNGRDARVYTITVTASDASGHSVSQSVDVRIAHNITGPVTGNPFILGSTVNFSGVFWDKQGNRHTGQWVIDDNTNVKGTITEPSGTKNGKVAGSYKFTTAGVYKLRMNVTDQSGITSYCNTNEDLEEIIVIYDPNGGYAYGGGWYNSPPGSLMSDPSASGKVSYGFSVNYFRNATNPKGETQFEFKAGDFEFNALNFDYLSVSPGGKAQFRGTGKVIGGQSGVAFIMTVVDGSVDGTGIDKVRMKIYNKNNNEVYYDNQPGSSDADNPIMAVGSNSNVVVSSSGGAPTQMPSTLRSDTVLQQWNVLVSPNPSSTDFRIQVLSDNAVVPVQVQVTDQQGRVVQKSTAISGQPFVLGAGYRGGIYYVTLTQGGHKHTLRLVKLN